MWWTIPLVIIVVFIWIGIPLILDYRAEKVEKSFREQSNKNNISTKIQGEEIMKNGEFICANDHAEFLNKAFGTNYKMWMKCVWKYNEEWTVWMVRFNKKDGGWKNTFVSDDRIKEEVPSGLKEWGDKPLSNLDKKRIVIQIEDLGYTRKYIYRGRYVYDEKNSDPYKVRYYDKVSD